MSKPVITRIFLGGLVAVIGGLVLATFAGLGIVAGSQVTFQDGDLSGFRMTPFAWSMVALALVGGLAVIAGALAGLAAWIGALLNTARLEDKLWFILLLVLGLFSFGLIAMIAYLIAGPDGTLPSTSTRAPASA